MYKLCFKFLFILVKSKRWGSVNDFFRNYEMYNFGFFGGGDFLLSIFEDCGWHLSSIFLNLNIFKPNLAKWIVRLAPINC